MRHASRSLIAIVLTGSTLVAVSCGDDDGASGSSSSPSGSWSITEYAAEGSMTSSVADSEPTLQLADDGTVAVTTGCNNGATTWEHDGDSLTFGMVASTLMACDDDLSVQESAIFAALEATASFEASDSELTLLDSDGETVLVAESS